MKVGQREAVNRGEGNFCPKHTKTPRLTPMCSLQDDSIHHKNKTYSSYFTYNFTVLSWSSAGQNTLPLPNWGSIGLWYPVLTALCVSGMSRVTPDSVRSGNFEVLWLALWLLIRYQVNLCTTGFTQPFVCYVYL